MEPKYKLGDLIVLRKRLLRSNIFCIARVEEVDPKYHTVRAYPVCSDPHHPIHGYVVFINEPFTTFDHVNCKECRGSWEYIESHISKQFKETA